MQIFKWNDILASLENGTEIPFFTEGCGISVGCFDGLHKGHRFLLGSLIKKCRENKILSGVVTFVRPLPSIKHSKDYKGDLSTLNQRIEEFKKIGLDFIIIVDFDDSFASMLGSDFFKLLVNVCNLKVVAEGIDFRCGYKGSMDVQALKYFCKESGIQTVFVNPVFYDSEKKKIYSEEDSEREFSFDSQNPSIQRVSSSYIRNLVSRGFLSSAAFLLERPYELDFSEISQIQCEILVSKIKQVLPPCGKYVCSGEEEVQILEEKIIMNPPSKKIVF